MASTQLFPGLMVVPWYNKAEWKTVKDALCGLDNKMFALERLEVWKKRTPMLPCGVEGTLELLHAFSLDLNDAIPDHVRVSLKGTAIMRFLNVCVAGRSRQGTFQKIAKDVGIPDYLINIRHVIAHESGDRPGEYLLDKGLEDCYKYVKENYWEPQDKLLKDYIYRSADDAQLHVYCEITYLRCFNNFETLQEVLDEDPSLLQWCHFTKVKFDSSGKVDDYLSEIYDKLHSSVKTAKFPVRIFAGTSTEKLQNDDNIAKQQVTIKSLDDWKDLVLLYGNCGKSLYRLIEHLVKTVIKGSETYEASALIGSVWLFEIFARLLQKKNEEKSIVRLDLNIEYVEEVIAKLKKLQGNILNQTKPCTVNFIKSFLLLLGFPEPYIDCKEQLVATGGSSRLKMPEPLKKFEEDFIKNLPEMDFSESFEEMELEPPEDLVEEKIDSRWSRADSRMVGHLRRKNSWVTPYMYHDY